ncbi:meiotic recombination protein spo11, putative [Trypanosoma cruzi marinkellei]|uniref:DNA topoisomerase (ATP-hydrolyzing) n=1 Tax=Trypanosoma cruzi marinkellei TaxID=85056 RepID=K2N0S1_TRYCR|nr:meiotic recombination protein spo11, putative [Trypanosoma cruzi marinkellei]
MLGDDEIIRAAEAVVNAYLVGLLHRPDAAITEASSQTHHHHSAPCGMGRQKMPPLCEAKCTSTEKKLNALRRTAQVLYVLSCVMDMLYQGLTCTERDVYYQNTSLFRNGQRDVHTSIERLCRWMDSMHPLGNTDDPETIGRRCYTREGLRIAASGKSILIGYISFDIPKSSSILPSASQTTQLTEGNVLQTQVFFEKTANHLTGTVEVNGMRHDSGILVNMAVGMRSCHFRGAEGVGSLPSALILVEKESTLRTLVVGKDALDLGAPLSRCFFLCSKGYPCRASRTLLHKLHRELPQLPIFVLVDGDPHGMRIALTFLGLFGGGASTRRRKQQKRPFSSAEFISTLLPVRWIGVRPSALPHQATGRAPLTLLDRQVLLQMTARVVEALSLLEDEVGDATCSEEEMNLIRGTLNDILREAEWMKEKSLKCALQAWPDGPLHLLMDSLELGRPA